MHDTLVRLIELHGILAAAVAGNDGIVIDKVNRFNFAPDLESVAALAPAAISQAIHIPEQLKTGDFSHVAFDFKGLKVIFTPITKEFYLTLVARSGFDYYNAEAEIERIKKSLDDHL